MIMSLQKTWIKSLTSYGFILQCLYGLFEASKNVCFMEEQKSWLEWWQNLDFWVNYLSNFIQQELNWMIKCGCYQPELKFNFADFLSFPHFSEAFLI